MKTAMAASSNDGIAFPRTAPEIDHARVVINHDGQVWRTMFVRLPKDMIADDLKEPSIWKAVQSTPRALRKFDELLLVSYNEDWFAECRVASASGVSVVLAKPRLTTMPERYEKLFSDGTYRVAWMGAGYVVERISDGQRMTQPVANVALAERELARLYPARVV